LTSSDAVKWIPRNAGASNNLWGVAYGGGQFVAVGWTEVDTGADQGRVFTSPDGGVWTGRKVNVESRLNGVLWGTNGFVAAGDNGAILQSGTNFIASSPALGTPQLLPGGAVQLSINGAPGQTYSIQASTGLPVWTIIGSVFLTNSPGFFVDQSATNFAARFYRTASP